MEIVLFDHDKEYFDTFYALLKKNGIEDPLFFYDDKQSFTDALQHTHYDVIFLNTESLTDIQDHFGNTMLVYITDQDEVILKTAGINVAAIVAKAKMEEEMPAIFHKIKNEIDKNTQVCFRLISGEIMEVRKSDVLYCEKTDHKCYVYIKDGKEKHVALKNLKDLFNILSSDAFVYINKGFLINVNHIKKLDHTHLYLKGINRSFAIEQNCYDEVKKTFLELIRI